MADSVKEPDHYDDPTIRADYYEALTDKEDYYEAPTGEDYYYETPVKRIGKAKSDAESREDG